MNQTILPLAFALALVPLGLAFVPTPSQELPTWQIESSAGDRIEVLFVSGQRPEEGLRICLQNAAGGTPKGFDLRTNLPPRHVTNSPRPVCIVLRTRVSQIFLSDKEIGGYRRAISFTVPELPVSVQELRVIWQ